MKFSIIVAVDEDGGFGKDGEIPWHFKKDFEHFKKVTKGAACIMGRKTYEEIRDKAKTKRILPGRDCYVCSRSLGDGEIDDAVVVGSLREAWTEIQRSNPERDIFVIGGEKLFIEALSWTNKIYLTVIKGRYDCDRFFPINTLSKRYKITAGEEHDKMFFVEYTKI